MADSMEPDPTIHDLSVDAVLLPADAYTLTPCWTGRFSDDDIQDRLTDASSVTTQSILQGGGCKDYYNWTRGAGSGIAGTDVGKIQSWIDFEFLPAMPTSSVSPTVLSTDRELTRIQQKRPSGLRFRLRRTTI